MFLVRSGSDIAKHHSMAPGCLEMHHRSGARPCRRPSMPGPDPAQSAVERRSSCAGMLVATQRKGVCVKQGDVKRRVGGAAARPPQRDFVAKQREGVCEKFESVGRRGGVGCSATACRLMSNDLGTGILDGFSAGASAVPAPARPAASESCSFS